LRQHKEDIKETYKELIKNCNNPSSEQQQQTPTTSPNKMEVPIVPLPRTDANGSDFTELDSVIPRVPSATRKHDDSSVEEMKEKAIEKGSAAAIETPIPLLKRTNSILYSNYGRCHQICNPAYQYVC